eukprot:9217727-Pyramimonas_sp.AAC.2
MPAHPRRNALGPFAVQLTLGDPVLDGGALHPHGSTAHLATRAHSRRGAAAQMSSAPLGGSGDPSTHVHSGV